jgi:hypothetical protein
MSVACYCQHARQRHRTTYDMHVNARGVTTGIALFAVRRRDENARHRFCRAPFPKAHGNGRPTHFYPVKNFVVRFGKRQRTAQLVAVRNR